MRRYLKTLLLLIAPLSVLADGDSMKDVLSITVDVAETKFIVDQVIQVVATVRNVGDAPVTIHKHPGFVAFELVLVGEDGTSVPRHVDRSGQYAGDEPQDFAQLDPGEAVQLTVNAKLLEGPVDVYGQGGRTHETLEGPVLEYGPIYLPVKHQGRYTLKAEYSITEPEAKDCESRFGFHDVWSGRIVSDGVSITIE